MAPRRQVVVAQIGAAHGIKGEVRLKSFTQDPFSVQDYGTLFAADGRAFEVETARAAAGSSSRDMLIVRLKGVVDRNAAEKLNGIELSVPQEKLPEAEADEFYHADLIGLAAVTTSGETLGTIVAVPNYGAGDLIEIAPPVGSTLLVPFTRSAVPEVDVAAGRVVVIPPTFDDDDDGAATAP
ncbi:MAG: ribosome maturation factor RimM [Bauldia sp.]